MGRGRVSYSSGPRRPATTLVAFQLTLTWQMLRQARDAGGWTQRDVSEATGISTSTIQYMEQGRQIPALDTLLTLVEFYGLRYDLSWEKEEGEADG